jgi:hypothetical protein
MECGMSLVMGVANCTHCGAKAGTLFEVNAAVNKKQEDRNKWWHRIPRIMDESQRIEKAQDRANTSVILGLVSFFPFLGLGLGLTGIIYAARALKDLNAYNVEDGKGSGMAGLVISSLGLVAQICLVIYAVRLL